MRRSSWGPRLLPGSWPAAVARRRGFRRRLLYGVFAAGWIVAGLIGAYSYMHGYYENRGFTPVKLQPGVRPGLEFWVHFYSPALGREGQYLVVLPTGYEPFRRYGAFYLLHGLPGRPQAYIRIASIDARLDNLISSGRIAPMMIVFPDGRVDGSAFSDSEWANTPTGAYESYVIDVVHDVDHRFATIADRGGRVIGGLSAGAYGAVNIALHHPAVFGSVESWSGYFVQSRSGVFANATHAQIVANSPLDYVTGLRRQLSANPLRVFLYSGRKDRNSSQIPRLARALEAGGATVQYALYRGGHDWALWHAHLDQMLILAARDVSRPPGPIRVPGPVPRRRAWARDRHRSHAPPPARARGQPLPGHAHAGGQTLTAASARAILAPVAIARRRPAGRRRDMTADAGKLMVGLLLALISAAAINLGFLLQHRGLSAGPRAGGHRQLLGAALRSRSWVAGQALGSAGFATQVAAVAIAPLALVQAFAAGGLALSVPLAARLFSHRISRRQAGAVLLIAAALCSLPIGLSDTGEHLHPHLLSVCAGAALVLAALAGLARTPSLQAIAAGLLYGVADGAVKAISVRWGAAHAAALLSGWTVLALLATLGGFAAFQAALRTGGAVTAISLMNALAALVALGCGLLGFAESLGSGPPVIAVHLVAITLVLACLPALAAAQSGIASEHELEVGHVPRTSRRWDRIGLGGRRASGQRAAGGEQQRLDPRTRAGPARPQHVGQPDIAREGKRELGSEQQEEHAHHTRNGGAPAARQVDQPHAGHDAGR